MDKTMSAFNKGHVDSNVSLKYIDKLCKRYDAVVDWFRNGYFNFMHKPVVGKIYNITFNEMEEPESEETANSKQWRIKRDPRLRCRFLLRRLREVSNYPDMVRIYTFRYTNEENTAGVGQIVIGNMYYPDSDELAGIRTAREDDRERRKAEKQKAGGRPRFNGNAGGDRRKQWRGNGGDGSRKPRYQVTDVPAPKTTVFRHRKPKAATLNESVDRAVDSVFDELFS